MEHRKAYSRALDSEDCSVPLILTVALKELMTEQKKLLETAMARHLERQTKKETLMESMTVERTKTVHWMAN